MKRSLTKANDNLLSFALFGFYKNRLVGDKQYLRKLNLEEESRFYEDKLQSREMIFSALLKDNDILAKKLRHLFHTNTHLVL